MSKREDFIEWWESRHYDDEKREMKKAAWVAWQAARTQAPASGEVEPVAWASPLPDGTEQVTKEFPERIYGLVPKDYQWYVRPLVYADTHPPAKVPEGFANALRDLVITVYHHMDNDGNELNADQCFAELDTFMSNWFTPTTAATPEAAVCEWRENGDYGWKSECGKEWYFEDGTPSDNGMHFCAGCGKTAVEIGGDGVPEQDGHDDAG